ncbi:DNA-binding response regulator [Candidatus Parcubacteria bacterium]|nr:MAG: DNA-binding response regulator [Candidatus Parcubacteria bacterium]
MKILLIEDQADIAEFILGKLKESDFTVDWRDNGNDGLETAQGAPYDLIILDYQLPGKNGREICRSLRASGKNTPILILSAKAETCVKIDLLNLGADDYIAKPFTWEELLARINSILRRPRALKEETLKIDNLVVHTKNHTVKRGHKDITLTKKEFVLLEFLLKNAGNTLSRAMIMEHVWDMNTDPFSNTVETHILNLRRKIDFRGQKKLIHTISGRGYKIDKK